MGMLRRNALRAARGLSAPAPKQAKGFPAEYKRMRSPIKRLNWLCGEEGKRAVSEGRIQQNQLEKEKDALNARMKALAPKIPNPRHLLDVWAGEEFPPRPADPANTPAAAAVLLDDASEREVLWPASYLADRYERESATGTNGERPPEKPLGKATYDVVCYETERCQRRMGQGSKRHTSSPTTAALEHLESVGGMLMQTKLATEDKGVLQQQIEHFNRTGDIRPFAS